MSILGRYGVIFPVLMVMLMACGCARGVMNEPVSESLELTLSIERAQVAPGEPLLVELTLTNRTDELMTVLKPDHESIAFGVTAREPAPGAGQRFVAPVFSEAEATHVWIDLAPGESLNRQFVFTVLTLERGAYALMAIARVADETRPSGERRVHAPAVGFEVGGEKVFARRYPDGLLAREEAIAIARRAMGASEAAAGETLLVRDSRGFARWWVNIGEGGERRAGLVDPVFARWLGELRPFGEDDRQGVTPIEGDTQALRELKDLQPWRRSEP